MNIVQCVNKYGFFSATVDESTVMSSIKQFSLLVFNKIDNEYVILEEFLCFIPIEDVTGKRL